MDPRDQEIRIFVSSTFRDFFRERELLVKQVFPSLTQICEERDVSLTEIDLRTGITHELSDEGHVLRICLEEIDRCQYFVCLLGERYGWALKDDDSGDQLLKKTIDIAAGSSPEFHWIQDRKNDSITELEIRHGFLNHQVPKSKCFFYFRDPSYVDSVSEAERGEYFESDPDLAKRQRALREEISRHPAAIVRSYRDPKEIVDLVHSDLRKAVEADFPLISRSDDPVLRERESHDSFARSRSKLFVGRDQELAQLDALCLKTTNSPLVVSAEPGSGKTSLLANWSFLFGFQKPGPFSLVVRHFLGSSPQSASHLQIIQRLMNEIKLAFSIEREVPTQTDNILGDLREWITLSTAPEDRSVLWVLDGLSELEDMGNARSLDWLPDTFPPRFKVVISAAHGDEIHKKVLQKGWGENGINLGKLSPPELSDIITGFLTRYNKGLTSPQVSLLLSNTFVSNPLFLVTVLKEVRLLGSFKDLNDQLKYYFSASSIPELFQKVLARLEKDYDLEGTSIVGKSLSALWTSRKGLTEQELVEYLGISRRLFSPFFLAVDKLLVNRSGLLSFFHQHFRQSVELRYIPDKAAKREVVEALADFFKRREFSQRVAEELPELLRKCGRTDDLIACLVNPDFFRRMYSSPFLKRDLFAQWALLHNQEEFVASYLGMINRVRDAQPKSKRELVDLMEMVAKFLTEKGEFPPALELLRQCVVISEEVYDKNDPRITSLMFSLSEVFGLNYDLDEQLELLEKVTRAQKLLLAESSPLQIADQTSDLAKTLAAVAERHRKVGDYASALDFLDQATNLETGPILQGRNQQRRMRILHNKAIILRRTKKREEASKTFQQALDLAVMMEGNDSLDAAQVRRDFAYCRCDSGRFKEAEVLLAAAKDVFLSCYGERNPIPRRVVEYWDDVRAELAKGNLEEGSFTLESEEENSDDDPEEADAEPKLEERNDSSPRKRVKLDLPPEINFSLGNHHERLELRKRTRIESAHSWKAFLSPAPETLAAFRHVVHSVVINLHPTFVRSRFVYSPRKRDKFEISGQGWGTFEIAVCLRLHAGFDPPELRLEHLLSFHETLSLKHYQLKITDHHKVAVVVVEE